MAQWANSRAVSERIFIAGKLVLETPAHFGNGDAEGLTDIPLLRDPLEGKALLTGASLAGALRNYLRQQERGYDGLERNDGETRAEQLFGYIDKRDANAEASVQSWLMVDDALGALPRIELRDGVALDPKTRTAEDKKKFDMELLQAGGEFEIRFELWVPRSKPELVTFLASALQGLEEGKITLGKRKHRGFGKCKVSEWSVCRYDMGDKKQVLEWLAGDSSREQPCNNIAKLLNIEALPPHRGEREQMTLSGTFRLDGSLLIRSSTGAADDPHFVHLKSVREGKPAPILSGTSAAGAIRARAQRIANTVLGRARAQQMIENMFGKGESQAEEKTGNRAQDKPRGSRVTVRETAITRPPEVELVQSRVRIDRFTGGAFPQALFQEQPLFGGNDTRVHIEIVLQQAKPGEVGLLLLVLKDLWTGDLALGGESSVGRGRLAGERADLAFENKVWTLMQAKDKVEVTGTGTRQALEDFVKAIKGEQ